MEKKTIGQFISALRKANGMTQKQLSEKLNVSDKAVSRWERDECAPDLTLIPVIAEIFGVTSDEILRGERMSTEVQNNESTFSAGKSSKQIEFLLNAAKTKFSVRSIISVGIASVGFLSAMLCNFGFNRAYVGFIVACILYLVSAVCETVFLNLAFSSVQSEYFESEKRDLCKKGLVSTAVLTYFTIIVLLVVSLPLVFLVNDAYFGLAFSSWLIWGFVYGVVAVTTCLFLYDPIIRFIIKINVYSVSEKEMARKAQISRFNKKVLIILVLSLAITFALQLVFYNFADIEMFYKGTTFDSVEDFISYMETPQSWEGTYSSSEPIYYYDSLDQGYFYVIDGEAVQIVPDNVDFEDMFIYDKFYYNDNGELISSDDFYTEDLINPDGEIFATYVKRNMNVSYIDVDWIDGVPYITVYTTDDYMTFFKLKGRISSLFSILALFEIIVSCAVLSYKRIRT